MNAWQIYLVMQLDDFKLGMGLFTAISAVFMGICLVGCSEIKDGDPILPRAQSVCRRAVAAFVLLLMGTIALPSTRTAAAMYVLPAIANDPNFRKDASELYELAVDAAKGALTKESE
jgi:hypothetical protein